MREAFGAVASANVGATLPKAALATIRAGLQGLAPGDRR